MGDILCSVFLLPAFLTIEWTRAALWASRATVDGPLRVFAVLLNAIALTPVWIILSYSATMVWLPVRALLWVWGIGRDGPKKRSPAATARWYESKAARRRVETVSVEEQRARLGWRY
ncbi:hypothetical protein BS17DRAFT_779979 [Gyrodon lividus]|nr:hypothetical protein BS17DRAFT_779979 [Gyrodon lividus]